MWMHWMCGHSLSFPCTSLLSLVRCQPLHTHAPRSVLSFFFSTWFQRSVYLFSYFRPGFPSGPLSLIYSILEAHIIDAFLWLLSFHRTFATGWPWPCFSHCHFFPPNCSPLSLEIIFSCSYCVFYLPLACGHPPSQQCGWVSFLLQTLCWDVQWPTQMFLPLNLPVTLVSVQTKYE